MCFLASKEYSLSYVFCSQYGMYRSDLSRMLCPFNFTFYGRHYNRE